MGEIRKHKPVPVYLYRPLISEAVMFSNRLALRQAIRMLARTLERSRAGLAAGAEFEAWLAAHRYLWREPPTGLRSKAVAWSAAEEWSGSIEWYILDDSVIGRPEYGGLFYEIPFADLQRMPALPDPRSLSRGLGQRRL